jgi:hypothetical protein
MKKPRVSLEKRPTIHDMFDTRPAKIRSGGLDLKLGDDWPGVKIEYHVNIDSKAYLIQLLWMREDASYLRIYSTTSKSSSSILETSERVDNDTLFDDLVNMIKPEMNS